MLEGIQVFNTPFLCFHTANSYTGHSSYTRGTQALPELVPRSTVWVSCIERWRYSVYEALISIPVPRHTICMYFFKNPKLCSSFKSKLSYSNQSFGPNKYNVIERINLRYCMYIILRASPIGIKIPAYWTNFLSLCTLVLSMSPNSPKGYWKYDYQLNTWQGFLRTLPYGRGWMHVLDPFELTKTIMILILWKYLSGSTHSGTSLSRQPLVSDHF